MYVSNPHVSNPEGNGWNRPVSNHNETRQNDRRDQTSEDTL